jgi:hypothetical protein
MPNYLLPFWCVFYVRQAIKTAAHDLVLHGIVNQSNRPSIINGVRFYDCCSNRVERRWISLMSGRNPRSSIRTSASTCFFRFNLKTKHVDFIHSFAYQCHVYYTKYYNATCNAVNTDLFKTALNLLGKIS